MYAYHSILHENPSQSSNVAIPCDPERYFVMNITGKDYKLKTHESIRDYIVKKNAPEKRHNKNPFAKRKLKDAFTTERDTSFKNS